MATEGTFVLSDIGGYTGFLTDVGIEHAKEITSDLFNALLDCNKGHWKIANIEGDCLFFYRPGREPTPELVGHIRRMYEVFCDRIVEIAGRAACPCGACTRINQLSLKFIVHAGEFDTQKIGNREELIGPDVVVAHRLLKNSVPLDDYALATRAYLGDDGDGSGSLALPAAEGRDEYDVGPVDYLYFDLEPVRSDVEKKHAFFVFPEESRIRLIVGIDAPADVVWKAIMDRESRVVWLAMKESVEFPGRRGMIGQVHRCVQANGSVTVEVTTAVDEADRRVTIRWFGTSLVRDCYFTFAVSELGPNSSGVLFCMKYREAIPIVSQVLAPVIKRAAAADLRRALRRLKDLCETKLSQENGRDAGEAG